MELVSPNFKKSDSDIKTTQFQTNQNGLNRFTRKYPHPP